MPSALLGRIIPATDTWNTWNKGSIAYHADDGKVFMGSGVGDPFGPRCNKGDIMGCGVLFPKDFESRRGS